MTIVPLCKIALKGWTNNFKRKGSEGKKEKGIGEGRKVGRMNGKNKGREGGKTEREKERKEGMKRKSKQILRLWPYEGNKAHNYHHVINN